MQFLLGFLLVLTAAFLIMIVLLQRGRGGGLAGAFGGMGGQSAFGAKAGDLFTKITIGVATFWILLCIASVKILNQRSNPFGSGSGANSKAPVSPDSAGGAQSKTSDKAGSASSTGTGSTAPGKSDSGAKSDGAGAAPAEKSPAPAAPPTAPAAPPATPPATTPSK